MEGSFGTSFPVGQWLEGGRSWRCWGCETPNLRLVGGLVGDFCRLCGRIGRRLVGYTFAYIHRMRTVSSFIQCSFCRALVKARKMNIEWGENFQILCKIPTWWFVKPGLSQPWQVVWLLLIVVVFQITHSLLEIRIWIELWITGIK